MIKYKQILNEVLHLFECEVLVKTDTRFNKIEIYNLLRAIQGVVVVKVEQNSFLDSKRTDNYEYSLLHIKYTVNSTPKEEIDIIKDKCIKIHGVLQFIPRYKTIIKKHL